MDVFANDFKFGKFEFRNSGDSEDKKEGIDGWVGSMPVATRRYRDPLNKYRQISIRKRYYSKSEYEKILKGEFKPCLYIFEYTDAYVICSVDDIYQCLRNKVFKEKANKDGMTAGCYIDLLMLPTLIISKGA